MPDRPETRAPPPVRRYALEPSSPSTAPSRLELARSLNAGQREAVEAEAERLVILAGAGTGKTRTLVYRVARLIERGADPSSIVLVTFTRRASREMIGRVESLLGPASRALRAGTFHRLAHAMLKRWAPLIGYRHGFTILDRDDAEAAMGAAIADLPEAPDEARLPKSFNAQNLIAALSLAINAERPVIELLAERQPELCRHAEAVTRALDAFQKKKIAMNAMDYDDLLVGMKTLLITEPAASEIRAQIAHVLVDEYQDTSHIQADLSERLARDGTLTVVGDDAQAIYRFRGAAPDSLQRFVTRHAPALVRLSENYRSTARILALAGEVIRRGSGQLDKSLLAVRPAGPSPVLIAAKSGSEEARFIAQRVIELCDEGIPLREQAVLYRAHSHSLELEVELLRRRIPYQVRSGARFFEQAHLKDVLAYLRLLHNPHDELAFRRVLILQSGIGTQSAARIWKSISARLDDPLPLAARLGDPALLAGLPRRASSALIDLAALFQVIEPGQDPGAMLIQILEGLPGATPDAPRRASYADHLALRYDDAEKRREEIAAFAELASKSPLEDLLGDVALADEPPSAAREESDPEARLTLSTVHQAKGLEWAAVFVAGLADGAFPHQTALEELEGEAEERRLMYVAVTRAKEQLYLISPAARTPDNRDWSLMPPSRYVVELERAGGLVERWALD